MTATSSAKTPVHVVSLGAGVQSSTMALMATAGLIKPMPVAAIFADTQDEPPNVYEWLGWLAPRLAFPVIQVTAGKLSTAALLVRRSKRSGQTYLGHTIPAFTINSDGSKGMWRRQCTDKHKLTILRRETLRLCGKSGRAIVWIGISTDEVIRMKPSHHSRIEHRWPLAMEHNMNRYHCLQWMKRQGYPEPPRSACEYCPLHSDAEWLRQRNHQPESFQRSVEFEKSLQEQAAKIPRLDGIPYLHDSRKPLSEVDFEPDRRQSHFGNECEGLCGV